MRPKPECAENSLGHEGPAITPKNPPFQARGLRAGAQATTIPVIRVPLTRHKVYQLRPSRQKNTSKDELFGFPIAQWGFAGESRQMRPARGQKHFVERDAQEITRLV